MSGIRPGAGASSAWPRSRGNRERSIPDSGDFFGSLGRWHETATAVEISQDRTAALDQDRTAAAPEGGLEPGPHQPCKEPAAKPTAKTSSMSPMAPMAPATALKLSVNSPWVCNCPPPCDGCWETPSSRTPAPCMAGPCSTILTIARHPPPARGTDLACDWCMGTITAARMQQSKVRIVTRSASPDRAVTTAPKRCPSIEKENPKLRCRPWADSGNAPVAASADRPERTIFRLIWRIATSLGTGNRPILTASAHISSRVNG
jgi:hypothetical protein